MLSRIPLGLLHNEGLVQSQTNRTVSTLDLKCTNFQHFLAKIQPSCLKNIVCKLITSRNIAENILYRTRYDFKRQKLYCPETYGTPCSHNVSVNQTFSIQSCSFEIEPGPRYEVNLRVFAIAYHSRKMQLCKLLISFVQKDKD